MDQKEKEISLSFFTNDMTVQVENPKNLQMHNYLTVMRKFDKVTGQKSIEQEQIIFFYYTPVTNRKQT